MWDEVPVPLVPHLRNKHFIVKVKITLVFFIKIVIVCIWIYTL